MKKIKEYTKTFLYTLLIINTVILAIFLVMYGGYIIIDFIVEYTKLFWNYLEPNNTTIYIGITIILAMIYTIYKLNNKKNENI
jgi:hypothetical protein